MRQLRVRTAATVLLGATLFCSAGAMALAEDAKPVLSTAGGIRDALTKLGEGRSVELLLNNGKSYQGKLGPVGNETVLVTQIAGKEFYDVLIEIDEISAIEVRVRGN